MVFENEEGDNERMIKIESYKSKELCEFFYTFHKSMISFIHVDKYKYIIKNRKKKKNHFTTINQL